MHDLHFEDPREYDDYFGKNDKCRQECLELADMIDEGIIKVGDRFPNTIKRWKREAAAARYAANIYIKEDAAENEALQLRGLHLAELERNSEE